MKNSYLDELKGKTYNNKTIADALKYLSDNKKAYYEESGTFGFAETALVGSLNKDEILGIGGSRPDDLVMYNWGYLQSLWMRTPTTSSILSSTTIRKIDDTVFATRVQNGTTGTRSTFNNWQSSSGSASLGTALHLGAGTTAPTRDDPDIETALATSPESAKFGTSTASYSNDDGTVTIANSIVAGGSGTIGEIGLYILIHTAYNASAYCMIAHDLVTPTVPFVASNTLTAQYVWSF